MSSQVAIVGALKVISTLLVSLLLLSTAFGQNYERNIGDAPRVIVVRCQLDASNDWLLGTTDTQPAAKPTNDVFDSAWCNTELLNGFAIYDWNVIDKAGSIDLIEIELDPDRQNECQPGGNAEMRLCLFIASVEQNAKTDGDTDPKVNQECRYGGKIGIVLCAQHRMIEKGFGWILPTVLILGIGSWVWSFVSSRMGKRNADDQQ